MYLDIGMIRRFIRSSQLSSISSLMLGEMIASILVLTPLAVVSSCAIPCTVIVTITRNGRLPPWFSHMSRGGVAIPVLAVLA